MPRRRHADKAGRRERKRDDIIRHGKIGRRLVRQRKDLGRAVAGRHAETHGLPFTLLSDPELQVITAYDVLKPPKDDKPSRSVSRSTYLIDEDGIIVKAFGAVKAKENPAQMLEVL